MVFFVVFLWCSALFPNLPDSDPARDSGILLPPRPEMSLCALARKGSCSYGPGGPGYIHHHRSPGAGWGPEEVDFPMVFLSWDGPSGHRAAVWWPEGPSQPRETIGKSISGSSTPGPTGGGVYIPGPYFRWEPKDNTTNYSCFGVEWFLKGRE